jgi:hypothetical protein
VFRPGKVVLFSLSSCLCQSICHPFAVTGLPLHSVPHHPPPFPHVVSEFPELWPTGYRNRARALGPGNPLLRSVVAHPGEDLPDPEGSTDPTGETLLSPLPYLVRKHRDRALVLVTSRCFIHCRFCFRRGQAERLPRHPARPRGAAFWTGS